MGSILGDGRCVIVSTSSIVLSRAMSGLRFYPIYKLTRQLFFSLTATFSKGRGHETPGSEIIFLLLLERKCSPPLPAPELHKGTKHMVLGGCLYMSVLPYRRGALSLTNLPLSRLAEGSLVILSYGRCNLISLRFQTQP